MGHRATLAGFALAASLLLGAQSPAFAGDGPGRHGPDWRDRGPPAYDFARARQDWLADCRARMAREGGTADARPGPDACEVFLDDFYARSGPAPYPHGYPGYGYAYGPGCCMGAPMVMAPVMRPARAESECTETVEYISEDVPARRQIRRAPRRAPDKRIRVN